MIQVNELKIGNLVYYNGNHKEVGIVTSLQPKFYPKYCETSKDIFIGLNQRHDIVYSVKDIQPIPITEEWLLKFGFEKKEFDYFILNYGDNECYFSYKRNNLELCRNIQTTASAKIKSLHQLQNLYFALTGEELQTTP